MKLDSHQIVRMLPLLAVVAVFAVRFIKGKAQETAEGLQFPMKPAITVLYGAVILAFGWFAYTERGTSSSWFQVGVLVALIVLIVYRMPGTITLSPLGLEQNFWLIKSKAIAYPDVMAVQDSGGRGIRVMGNTGVNITHSSYHVDADRFRTEVAARTGKKVVSA